ncbi:hypothetical protein B0I37DRAFT_231719 [Chaetomium sp. MPI-CAGE-AT-0009]|nr:hypothetical protein B0I37DRAFT_231719 [Chaetomium sp. MPI-CAGE-AT-0009]
MTRVLCMAWLLATSRHWQPKVVSSIFGFPPRPPAWQSVWLTCPRAGSHALQVKETRQGRLARGALATECPEEEGGDKQDRHSHRIPEVPRQRQPNCQGPGKGHRERESERDRHVLDALCVSEAKPVHTIAIPIGVYQWPIGLSMPVVICPRAHLTECHITQHVSRASQIGSKMCHRAIRNPPSSSSTHS